MAELEKVRAVDRGPWLPAAGSEMPTMNVMKLGSPRDFSFRKASTAGDPDFTWERSQGWRYAFCTAGHLGQQPLSWTQSTPFPGSGGSGEDLSLYHTS